MKTIKIFYIISLLTVLAISGVSCKRYLEKKQDNSLTVPESLEALQGLLDDANIMNTTLTPSYGEASADDYFIPPTIYANITQPQYLDMYRFIPTEYNFQNDWSRAYGAVYNANYCLEGLEKIPVTSQNVAAWNNIKGSALVYRSYNFLMLAWNYCKSYDELTAGTDLGIALRLSSDFNVPSARLSVKETYERIIKDAIEAIQYLPATPIHVFRPSQMAAFGVLARTYLSMRKYDSAFKYSNLCLQIKNQLMDYNADPEVKFPSSPSVTFFPFTQFNKETIFYTEMSFLTANFIGITRARIDTTLYPTYSTTDARKSLFFQLMNAPYYNFRGSYTQSSGNFTGLAVDEVYLMRAECYARKGDKDAAMADLNLLLSKRLKPVVTLTAVDAADALAKILVERRKELIFRGLRWMDIKRLNKEGANIIPKRVVSGQTYTLQPNANYYALPLPTDIIKLTGMPQNPL